VADRFDELHALLRDLNRGFHILARGVLDRRVLPPPSLSVLRHVFDSPGLTVSEIARQTGMAKSYVSRTVESLCQTGLLAKSSDPVDQRLVRIHPTPQARADFQRMHAAVRSRFASVISRLPDEKADALIDGLRALQAAIERETEREKGGGRR
jgi:DNA-binding MarR family transcriptional regulator